MNDPSQPGRDPAVTCALGGFAAALVGCCVADGYLPHAAGTALTWVVILGCSYGMALWNRRRAGWVAFWAVAGLCVAGVGVQVTGLVTGPSVVGLVVGAGAVLIYYWLTCMGRLRVAEPPARQEVHHFHHVVPPAPEPGPVTVTATVGRAPLPAQPQRVITGQAVRAIAPPHKVAGGLLAAAREAVRERR